jgi:outer membrane protein TolC
VICRLSTRLVIPSILLVGIASFSSSLLDAEPYTFEKCVAEAKVHNPDLAAAEQAIRASEAQKRAAYSGYLPQLSASASAVQSNSTTAAVGAAQGLQGPVTTEQAQYTYGITASENLFSGFKDQGKLSQAEANLEVSRQAFDIARAKVTYDLRQAFTNLLYYQNLVDLLTKIEARLRGNVRLVGLRFDGGAENKGSYLQSKASLAQASFEVEQAKRFVEVTSHDLARAMGRPDLSGVSAEGSLDVPDVKTENPDYDSLVKVTPQHKQAIAQSRAAEAAVTVARAQFFPSLDVNGSYSRFGIDTSPNSNRFSVGVSLTFPFFPGGQNIFLAQSASAARVQAEFTQASTDNQLRLTLQQSFLSLQNAVGLSRVSQEYLDASTSRATIARGKYSAGLMSFEDWDLIENDLTTRQKTALSNRKDALIAYAAWDQAQGKGVVP